MRAHPNPTPSNNRLPMDSCILDEEFDLFEAARSCDRQYSIEKDMLVCADGNWDEYS